MPDLFTSMMEVMQGLPTWNIYMKWAAIAAISGAAERRLWTRIIDHAPPIYPNLFIGFIGPPSNGKTFAIRQTETFWRSTGNLRVAPDKLTAASLIDEVNDCVKTVPIPGQGYVTYHSLQIASEEMSALVPVYDMGFMGILNKLYDCYKIEERLRTRKQQMVTIPNVQATLLAGGQPDYLTAAMPAEAWGQGFLSRCIFIWGDHRERVVMFDHKDDRHRHLHLLCEDDLKQITSLVGAVRWSPEVEKAGDAWVRAGGPPTPTHPKLHHYCGRRHIHLTKLATVSCLSRGNSLTITMADWERALSWLLEAEAEIPKIFRAMATGGDGMLMFDTWLHCWENRGKYSNGAVPERHIVHFIAQRMSAQSVPAVLKNMVSSGMLRIAPGDQRPGFAAYLPLPQEGWDPEVLQRIAPTHA